MTGNDMPSDSGMSCKDQVEKASNKGTPDARPPLATATEMKTASEALREMKVGWSIVSISKASTKFHGMAHCRFPSAPICLALLLFLSNHRLNSQKRPQN